MIYIFLIIAIICALYFLIEIAKTMIGKIIIGIIIIVLLGKLIKFIKRYYKYFFKVTKKSIMTSLFVILGAVFTNEVMLASFSDFTHKIIYIITIGIVVYLQKNPEYKYKRASDKEEKEIIKQEKMFKNMLGDNWKQKKAELEARIFDLQKEINSFRNSQDKSFKLEWLNKYGSQININSNYHCKIRNLLDIKNEGLRLEIVEYTKDKLCTDELNFKTLDRINGSKDNIRINLPIKIIEVQMNTDIKKFVGKYTIKKLVVEENNIGWFHTDYNIICYEEDFLDRNVILINENGIVKDMVTCNKNFGSFDDTFNGYGTINLFDDGNRILKDYR